MIDIMLDIMLEIMEDTYRDIDIPHGLNTCVGLFLSMEFSNTKAIGTKLPRCLQRGQGFSSNDW
jgi:hypothetical protein